MHVYHCIKLSYTTQHRTVLIIFPSILQTIIIAQMMSSEVEVGIVKDPMMTNDEVRLPEVLV